MKTPEPETQEQMLQRLTGEKLQLQEELRQQRIQAEEGPRELPFYRRINIGLILTVLILALVAIFAVPPAVKRIRASFEPAAALTVVDKSWDEETKVEKVEEEAPAPVQVAPAFTQAQLDQMLQAAVAKAKEETPEQRQQRELREENEKILRARLDKLEKDEADRATKAVETAKKQEAETEEADFAARQVTDEVIDNSKNFKPKARETIGNEEKLEAAITEWHLQDGYSFPLVLNRSGNPGPVKGESAPEFLIPGGDWDERTVTIKTKRGNYTTTGWGVKGAVKKKTAANTAKR